MHAKKMQQRKQKNQFFKNLSLIMTLITITILFLLLYDVFKDGIGWLNWNFLTSYPSRFPEQAGIKSALVGSLWMISLTTPIAIPIGVMTAIYLEEYAPKNRLTTFIRVNIANLAGVPSIVFGILGLTIFVRTLGLGRSVLAGSLTMALLILPIIIVASQEAVFSVPNSLRDASYALGATRWQTVRYTILPASLPSILTGIILATSRAIGETAPLIMVGALTYIAFLPSGPLDPFTVLPIQIFNWTSRPNADFHGLAAAGIIVLLAVLLLLNTTAILLRTKYQRRLND